MVLSRVPVLLNFFNDTPELLSMLNKYTSPQQGYPGVNVINDIQIPETQWGQFCESFSHQHHGWLINIREFDTGQLKWIGTNKPVLAHMVSEEHPLQEIREAQKDDHADIMITVGEGSNEISFLIEDIVALYNRKTSDAHLGLRIDGRNGTTTLLEFLTPAEPEALDGLAEVELEV